MLKSLLTEVRLPKSFDRLCLGLCLFTIVGCAPPATNAGSPSPAASASSATASLPEAEVEEATLETAPGIIKELDQKLKIDPDDRMLWVRRIQANIVLGNRDAAISDLDALGKLDGGSKWVRNNRAFLRAEKGEFEDALPDALAAVEAPPDEPMALDTLGYVYVGLGRDKEAVDAYSRALAFKVKPNYLWGRAVALRRLGQTQAAEADFQEALALKPGFSLHWNQEPDPGLYPASRPK